MRGDLKVKGGHRNDKWKCACAQLTQGRTYRYVKRARIQDALAMVWMHVMNVNWCLYHKSPLFHDTIQSKCSSFHLQSHCCHSKILILSFSASVWSAELVHLHLIPCNYTLILNYFAWVGSELFLNFIKCAVCCTRPKVTENNKTWNRWMRCRMNTSSADATLFTN